MARSLLLKQTMLTALCTLHSLTTARVLEASLPCVSPKDGLASSRALKTSNIDSKLFAITTPRDTHQDPEILREYPTEQCTTPECLVNNHGFLTKTFSERDTAASTQEPVIEGLTPDTSSDQGTGPVTTDGTCGAQNANTICGDWPKGSCCSQYGWCGNSNDHCGNGCQSGPCQSSPIAAVPSARAAPANPDSGQFIVVANSIVPVMHSALLPNGNLVFLDKVENFTYARLPSTGQFAYSVEYNPATGTTTPLAYKTNAFCAGGSFLADGETLISIGGNGPLTEIDPTVGNGFNAIRYLKRDTSGSMNGGAWLENAAKLSSNRWYPSAQILSDGTIFVASGSLNGLDPTVAANNNPTYELLSPQGVSQGVSTPMDILIDNQPYYMYPFLALLPTGDVLVFVSKSAQVFQPKTNKIVRTLPNLPGLYRTYPNTGGAQLLALRADKNWDASFLVCGGGAYQDISSPTDPSCGRISPLSSNPQWELDAMPEGRVMGEMQLLPDGKVLILNGADQGAQGFGLGADPTTQALLYDPNAALGKRFSILATSTIPRLYHSTVNLLPNGSVLVSGSNPNQMPVLTPRAGAPYITEFRVEIFQPPYLCSPLTTSRNVQLSTYALRANGMKFTITFEASRGPKLVTVSLFYPGFNTHSLHMGERLCILDHAGFMPGAETQRLSVTMPPSTSIAPPGGAWLFVLADGVPADTARYVVVS